MKASLEGRRLRVTIQDFGKGIENIELAETASLYNETRRGT